MRITPRVCTSVLSFFVVTPSGSDSNDIIINGAVSGQKYSRTRAPPFFKSWLRHWTQCNYYVEQVDVVSGCGQWVFDSLDYLIQKCPTSLVCVHFGNGVPTVCSVFVIVFNFVSRRYLNDILITLTKLCYKALSVHTSCQLHFT